MFDEQEAIPGDAVTAGHAASRLGARGRSTRLPHTAVVRVTRQYRVDAPLAWVRQFLVQDTAEEDRTLDGDTVVVRQSNTFLRLTVTNQLSEDAAVTVLDIDADLRLRGLGLLAGSLFRSRLRRALERSLDGLPHAIEVALEQADPRPAPGAADGYSGVTVGADHIGGVAVTRIRTDADATTLSEASQDEAQEADDRVPQTPGETVDKAMHEAAAGQGLVETVKRVARELDRTAGGEYEAREDRRQGTRSPG
ncbi:MAG: hypothetical protein ACYDAC_01415 [Candidatus Dormibacteria bacterium]